VQFLSPWIWLAALSVSIPVILHLTRKESKHPKPFASLMFFQRIPLQEFRRRRLREILLLALRCLAIFFLVAAFARPVLTEWVTGSIGQAPSSTVILVDTSLSMSRPAVWEKATSAVEDVISRMGRLDESLLAYFGLSNGTLTHWEKDKNVLRNAANERLRPSAGATSYASGLGFAARQFEQVENSNRKIILITDLQRSGVDRAALAELILPAGISLEIIDVGDQSRNYYIAGMQIEREIFSNTYTLPVIVHVAGPGEKPNRGELRLYLENELTQRVEFTVSGKGMTPVPLNPFKVAEGITRGRAVLGLQDDLAEDDVYYFVLERKDPFPIRLISGDSEESAYLKEALDSGENLPFQTEFAGPGLQLGTAGTRVLVLDDPPRIPPPESLRSFVSKGGGLILAHGRNCRPEVFSSLEDLLPGKPVERRFARSYNSTYLFLDRIRFDHPVFSPFEGMPARLLGSVQFYAYWSISPAEDSQVPARFNNQDPALLERQVGRGRILQMATSLGRSWSDFPLRSSYVPFWHRAVRYVAGWNPQPDSYRVADLIALKSKVESDAAYDWEILDPNGRRVIALGEKPPDAIRFELPGFYEIRHNKGTDWKAVNTDPRESDFSPVTREELLNLLPFDPESKIAYRIPAGQPEQPAQPVWWIFLVLSALLFFGEAFYSNRQRRRRDQFA